MIMLSECGWSDRGCRLVKYRTARMMIPSNAPAVPEAGRKQANVRAGGFRGEASRSRAPRAGVAASGAGFRRPQPPGPLLNDDRDCVGHRAQLGDRLRLADRAPPYDAGLGV